MLFNSFQFILLFLPITLFIFHTTARINQRVAFILLTLASLLFYSFDNAYYAALLALSIAVNFILGEAIRSRKDDAKTIHNILFIVALLMNLLLLGYFKYTNFFTYNINELLKTHISTSKIDLPPGISFYTFVQIAYIVDAYKGKIKNGSFAGYSLFVSFFPHLIAGPIIHINDMMPQFYNYKISSKTQTYIAAGISIFTIGLAKKVLVADLLAEKANQAYALIGAGHTLSTLDAWIGSLSYTLQIYYDFSGYSDMAIGLAYMFGIKFPINFNSPYKATSIIDFWRRWHITLSQFLRDYIYIPLGGNKAGATGRYRNLMLTMLLGGLWHGAGWNFVLWGGIHGSLLVCAHMFRAHTNSHQLRLPRWTPLITLPLTFFCVHMAWIPFRAEDLYTSYSMATSLFTNHGDTAEFTYVTLRTVLMVLLATVLLPNTQQLFPSDINSDHKDYPIKSALLTWSSSKPHAFAFGLLLTACLFSLTSPSTFIYFRF
ncbi:MBOAT family O-acyltransferase [Nitratidesulfovibrio liaohensis]|uniref:MBOAT family protein n=1 Tax=Nitratidesulfovibrio liaohensis TaxID=2604158 RepID=A0ABY9QZL1_9BACT|nr:MBOAT family O-acyltransferase [Nitratidesulfovibrio liaohensis]WMW63988.1 MBOAT family protein [Nitratidesulfovibrio liaohensis]